MKRFSLVLFNLFVLLFSINVYASSMDSLKVDVYIEKNGDAKITEEWTVYANQGTELYKPMNLDGREIKDFVVSENGKKFEQVSWNVNKSREEKSQKYGINENGGGIELCWGIGNYGNHTYKLEYTLTDVITKYKDADATLFKLVNDSMNPAPEKVYIDVKTYYSLPDTIDVWGYGYKGYAYVKDGFIHMENEDYFYSSDYVVLLAKFPLGTFETDRTEDKTFDELYEGAEEGTFEYDYGDTSSSSSDWKDKISFILTSLFFGFIAIFTGLAVKNSGTKYDYGEKGKKISDDEALYFRDIPCKKDIFRAYYIATKYDLIKNKTDFLGAVLLKWLKDKDIEVLTEEKKGLLGRTKEETTIDLTKELGAANDLEVSLHKMFVTASKDKILSEGEMKKWSKTNYNQLLNWFDRVINNQEKKLKEEGLIKEEKVKKGLFTKTTLTFTDELRNEAVQLKGLKNFFKDFTIIKERQSIEVITFEYYIIFAQIFGIAEKVAKEFKDMYPELIEQAPEFANDNIFIVHDFSHNVVQAASAARSAAESYSSGGGGFSSGGGGGGSFGGGSGGGIR